MKSCFGLAFSDTLGFIRVTETIHLEAALAPGSWRSQRRGHRLVLVLKLGLLYVSSSQVLI